MVAFEEGFLWSDDRQVQKGSRVLFGVRKTLFFDDDDNIDIAFEIFADSLVASLISWRFENPVLKTFDE